MPAWITFTRTCGNDEASSSLIAARTTARLAPHGRVLELVPTLDLLSRTVRPWRAAGRKDGRWPLLRHARHWTTPA
ncbi:hypothetical protein ACWC9U_05050 [Streptomyces sp. 900116325]